MPQFAEIEARARQSCVRVRGLDVLLDLYKRRAPDSYRGNLIAAELWRDSWLSLGHELDERWYRAACAYDVGKLWDPDAFGENQLDFNPHELVKGAPAVVKRTSFKRITSHVSIGVWLVDSRLKLSYEDGHITRSAIIQHHGTYPTFLGPEYRYGSLSSGRPLVLETALLMICDVGEALLANVNLTPDQVEVVLREQVALREEDGQFADLAQGIEDRPYEISELTGAVIESLDQVRPAVIKNRRVPVWNALEGARETEGSPTGG